MREWLDEAVFYEIYPQSFCDSNADGIGDINGIIEKLDYIEDLGFNALWLNPIFDSPFVDAGYDVRDYRLVAPRYGTNADIKRLFDECHRRGMHVLMDLVVGHTSDQCSWFVESAKADRNEFTDRYVWTDSVWEGFGDAGSICGAIRGGTERDGTCAANFFNAQPALNFGFANPDPKKPWQQGIDDEGPRATREAMKDVMRFWLDMGCDGFRVDMAGSLVKADPGQRATIRIWQDFREFLQREYPEAVMVSEWGEPDKSLMAGFHMDFVLHFGPSHYLDLFRVEEPYFSRRGKGDCKAFFDLYMHNKKLTEGKGGLICIPSGNHDMIRIAKTLDPEEMRMAYAFILSMPGVPFFYYGDEIGMKYVEGLKSVEGGYERTGSRSPMAFDRSVNGGFSAAPEYRLYIRQDISRITINAAAQRADGSSLLNEIRRLTQMRREHPALGNRGEFEILQMESFSYPLVYRRSAGEETILVILNPSGRSAELKADLPAAQECIYSVGAIQAAEKGSLMNKTWKTGDLFPAASAVFLKI